MAKIDVTKSSGNVFEDLGLPEAAAELAKAQLAREVGDLIEERELTQVEAAEILGVDQPKVSAVLRGRLEGFSTERLFKFLNALGRDVEIVVKPVLRKKKPSVRVVSKARSGNR